MGKPICQIGLPSIFIGRSRLVTIATPSIEPRAEVTRARPPLTMPFSSRQLLRNLDEESRLQLVQPSACASSSSGKCSVSRYVVQTIGYSSSLPYTSLSDVNFFETGLDVTFGCSTFSTGASTAS